MYVSAPYNVYTYTHVSQRLSLLSGNNLSPVRGSFLYCDTLFQERYHINATPEVQHVKPR